MAEVRSAARETVLRAADGTALFIADNLIEHAQDERRGFVLIHGLGEHGECYKHASVRLTPAAR